MSTTPSAPGFDQRSVVVGTAYLMAGNVAGQLVSLVGLLLISRIYTPADVGLWAMFLSIGFMVPLLAGMRYDLAAVIVDSDEDSARLMVLTMLLGLGFAALVLLIAFFIYAVPFGISPVWVGISFAYAPYIALNGVLNAGNSWAIRRGMFFWLMVFRLAQPGLTLLVQYLNHDVAILGNGLIYGTVIGCLLTALISLPVLLPPLRLACRNTTGISDGIYQIRAIARQEKSFPLYSVPYAIVGTFANQVIVVAMGAWYSLTVVGLFNMAYRTLNAPMMLVGSALSQSIMPVLARAKNQISSYEDAVIAFMRLLGWIYIPALVFIVFHGQAAYSVVFGPEWAQAGYYAGFLTMAFFGTVLTQWFERIFDILGRQKLHLFVSIVLNGIVLLAFTVVHMLSSDPVHAVIAWSVGVLFYATSWITIVFRMCKFRFSSLARLGLELGGLLLVTVLLVDSAMRVSVYAAHVAMVTAIFISYGIAMSVFLKKDFIRFFSWAR